MRKYVIISLIAFNLLGYSKESNNDTQYPKIELSQDAFPVNCSEVKRGQTLNYKVTFTDNIELGAYTIDIHDNFKHHGHSTEVNECKLSPKKDPINPFKYLPSKSSKIPAGKTSYQATGSIEIPNDIDTGDYHFMYKVTDKNGWQSVVGLSIKIVE